MSIPLEHGVGFTHWQPWQAVPGAQSASASHSSAPHTRPSPQTGASSAQTHCRQLRQGSVHESPGSPHCSPGSTVPSPQLVSWAS